MPRRLRPSASDRPIAGTRISSDRAGGSPWRCAPRCESANRQRPAPPLRTACRAGTARLPEPRHRQARLLQGDSQPAQLFLGPGQPVGHRPLGPARILGDRLQMHGAQPSQIAQAKRFIDTLHDAFSPLPLLVIAGQIGMQPLRQVDVQPFRFDRLGRQPAARGRGDVRSARYASRARRSKGAPARRSSSSSRSSSSRSSSSRSRVSSAARSRATR